MICPICRKNRRNFRAGLRPPRPPNTKRAQLRNDPSLLALPVAGAVRGRGAA